MIADSVVGTARPLETLLARVGTWTWLCVFVLGSAVLRSIAAVAHLAPTYFPDEYIYTAISRSLATSGRPLIRGGSAHFPALLEPLLTAPIWALASAQTAYHLIQIENALFMSLAAIPAYLLARRVDLGNGWALACAAYTVAIPDLAFSGFLITDPLAYPLVLTAIYFGVVALQAPTRRSQLAFIAFAGLATFARLQYVVLVPAFIVAVAVIERRSAFRVYRLSLALFGTLAALVAAFGAHRVLGFYSGATSTLGLSGSFLHWAWLNLFFLALAGGVVVVPGAVVGLLAPGGQRRDRSFSALVIPFALAVMVEAASFAASGPGRFKERYLFMLLPLFAIAFGMYVRRGGQRGRLAVASLAAGIAVAAALLPLSGYVTGANFSDSPLLWAYEELQSKLGVGNASLVAALGVTVAAVLAATAAWLSFHRAAMGIAIVLVAAISVSASVQDVGSARQVRLHLNAPDPTWVDDAQIGPVSAIETELAPAGSLIEQLFWNGSIKQELLLGEGAGPTDVFATRTLRVEQDGVLTVGGKPLRTAILFQGFETTGVLENVKHVASWSTYSLWQPTGPPRLSVLEVGRFWDGWLGSQAGIEVWPGASRSGGTVSFTLSLPPSRPHPVTVTFERHTYRLSPGSHVLVRVRIPGSVPWSASIKVRGGMSQLPDRRPVSLRSSTPVFTPASTSVNRRESASLDKSQAGA